MTTKDCCSYLNESCVECQLIEKDEVVQRNKVRQLQSDIKEHNDAQLRKIIGGSL